MYKWFLKRAFDFVLAAVLSLLFLPLFAATFAAVRLKIGSPVFFTQMRPGQNGKIFKIYKFRTMTNEKDENGELLPDEQRLKGVGKTIRRLSLDELPQILNVLKGEMSFVGPRPLLPEYLPLYNARQAARHDVAPGITGLAQVMGRNAISWDEKLEWDAKYAEQISFWLDMKILALTALKVVKSEGVSKDGMATTDKFRGSKA
ncbi:MAG TPA: sugar transferase [Campylobacterales bacterium]|nr:sugar transferase [Campylobacterales bacterium]